MNRFVGIAATFLWLAAMILLIRRDVLPFWTAQEAPAQSLPNETYQVAIRHAEGSRVGTAWVRLVPTSTITTVRSTTLLDLDSVAGVLNLRGPVVVDMNMAYQAGGTLDQFRIRVEGMPLPIHAEGERIRSDMACTLTFGVLKKSFSLDGRLMDHLAETIRPFTHLKNLHVGQRWRLRLLNPIPLLQSGNLDLKISLVRVTARELIDHQGRRIECFRVETEGAVAWVDDTGRVLRQEVQIPLLGKWTLTDETYDPRARARALAAVKEEAEAAP